MNPAYREYLELYEYFGRSGHVRLSQADFILLHDEFERLVAAGPAWTREQAQRLVSLREVLMRDRPRLRELMPVLERRSS
jgi:hypothetical protein